MTKSDIQTLGNAPAASVFVGDKVRIEGLVTAQQYNGLRGLVVSAVDSGTCRCRVQFRHDGIDKTVSILMQNLVLVRRAKKLTRCNYMNIYGPPETLQNKEHIVTVVTFGDKCSNEALEGQNTDLLRDFEGVAPDDETTNSIITKWRDQKLFVRFMNGDTNNCHPTNLKVVSLKNAMENIRDWIVDWDMDLTDEEIQLVQGPAWRLKILLGGEVEGEWSQCVEDEKESSGDEDEDIYDEESDDDSSADEDELTKSILRKWRSRPCPFIRFMNGNHQDCSIPNLVIVSLDNAMDHIDDWKVDWDMDLTRSQIQLVRDPVWRAGLSQPTKLDPEARLAYKDWCVTYGKVPSEAKLASFKKNYVGMKRTDALEKAKALVAGTEYVPRPFVTNECCDMTFAEIDALSDRFEAHLWAPLLYEEASQAYDAWCDKYEKEPSDDKFTAFKLNYMWALINAVTAEPLNAPYLNEFVDNEYMDMTEIELAVMKDANEDE
jgi:hypothetical protein